MSAKQLNAILFMVFAAAFNFCSAASAQYTQTVLASFTATSSVPLATLVMDSSGNLYGTTTDSEGSTLPYGIVFELANNANHTFSTLATFNGTNGAGSYGSLIMDSSGNLFGTTTGPLALGGGY